MKYFSTFSGIGGFELGIGDKAECVGFSEIDTYATQIYQKHFPNHKNYGDITRITAESIPDFDLFVGGFPCQAFSIAGKRAGFQDTRGTLFFDIARILKHKRPRYILLENVKGLLSHDNGKTFQTILTVLTDIGYDIQWQVLNSKNFGVPQNRERVFIVGHLGGRGRRQIFPIGQSNSDTVQGREEQKGRMVSNAIDSSYYKGADGKRQMIEITKNVSDAQRVYNPDGLAKTLKGLGGGQGAKTGLYTVGSGIRRLTPTECCRLQGFPDDWVDGLSDTQKYKTLGNAVSVPVIKAIVEILLL